MFKRIISIGLPAVLFLASLGWYYGNLLTGARRLVHDTSIFFHPGLAYLSDSLAQGVFPFWDPFSTPGASTAVLQIYSPLYIAFEWLLYHSQEVVVLYFICFGLLGTSEILEIGSNPALTIFKFNFFMICLISNK